MSPKRNRRVLIYKWESNQVDVSFRKSFHNQSSNNGCGKEFRQVTPASIERLSRLIGKSHPSIYYSNIGGPYVSLALDFSIAIQSDEPLN